jgi:hypothetical protein
VVVLLVIVGAVVFALVHRGSEDTDPSTAGATSDGEVSRTELVAAPSSARCLPPSVDILRRQDLAFDGVVKSVAGGLATLEPTHFYAGAATDVVVVKAPDGDLQQLLAAVDFREGERYLVSANHGAVTVCGFSAPYTRDLAALYDEAFGG